jgi:hypothetical protein
MTPDTVATVAVMRQHKNDLKKCRNPGLKRNITEPLHQIWLLICIETIGFHILPKSGSWLQKWLLPFNLTPSWRPNNNITLY